LRKGNMEAEPRTVNPLEYRHVFGAVMIGNEEEPGLLKQAGLSIAELARRTGIRREHLQRYLSGDRFPGATNGRRIADALGIPWKEFRLKIVTRERQCYCPDLIVYGERRQDEERPKFRKRLEANYKAVRESKENGQLKRVILPSLVKNPYLARFQAEANKGGRSIIDCINKLEEDGYSM